MKILGIESSCDDTSVCVAYTDAGRFEIGSLVVQSQDEVHRKYGGVVPELAARNHIQNILPCFEEALRQAGIRHADIDAVCVTQGPGLIGSLLVGTSVARALSYIVGKPMVCVDHIQAHLFSPLIENEVPFPFLGMVVSGGHTSMCLVRDYFSFEKIGETYDDAAGEALDKGAKMLNLGYPGGRAIDEAARQGNPKKIAFPVGLREKGNLDFSFSGLKTALYVYLKDHPVTSNEELADVCASYQNAVVQALIYKIRQAARQKKFAAIAISGGVACNSQLRRDVSALAESLSVKYFSPSPKLCTDNAAMTAFYGWQKLKKGDETNPCDGEAYAWKDETK